jgi:hypothetical protein
MDHSDLVRVLERFCRLNAKSGGLAAARSAERRVTARPRRNGMVMDRGLN